MITSVFIILLMLLLSAFFSGMEIAFTSKNRLKLEIDRKQSRLFNFIADINHHHLRRRISPEIRFPEQPEFLLPPVCSCDLFLLSAAFSDRQADDLDFPGDFVADGA